MEDFQEQTAPRRAQIIEPYSVANGRSGIAVGKNVPVDIIRPFTAHNREDGITLLGDEDDDADSDKDRNEKWYKRPIGIIVLSVSSGAILLAIRFLVFGS